jgi:flagellar motility protein MotE (MotC chaperone)
MSRRRGPGRIAALPLIVLFLVASVVARFLSGTGGAIAREVQQMTPEAHDEVAQCVPDPEIAPILDKLAAREARVGDAETRAANREQAAIAAEARLAERLSQLEAAERNLAATMATTSTAAESDLAQLTSAYETMKPKDAVPLFEAMDADFAAGFLSRMRPDAAGAIMAGMDPKAAYAVSAILAGRNARVPTD